MDWHPVISVQQQTPDNDFCHFTISNVRFALWAFFSKTGKTRGLTPGQNDDPVTRKWKMTQMTHWPAVGDPMTQFHVWCEPDVRRANCGFVRGQTRSLPRFWIELPSSRRPRGDTLLPAQWTRRNTESRTLLFFPERCCHSALRPPAGPVRDVMDSYFLKNKCIIHLL